jgi:serine O-acetyltransferase
MANDLRKKDKLPELTGRIVDTYKSLGKISYLGHCLLPNLTTVIAIVEDLKEIMYPGYRRRQNLHLGNVIYHVGDLVDSLHDTLGEQRSMRRGERGQFFGPGR